MLTSKQVIGWPQTPVTRREAGKQHRTQQLAERSLSLGSSEPPRPAQARGLVASTAPCAAAGRAPSWPEERGAALPRDKQRAQAASPPPPRYHPSTQQKSSPSARWGARRGLVHQHPAASSQLDLSYSPCSILVPS